MIGWLERLPDELLRGRPGLSLDYAGALLSFGAVENAVALAGRRAG